MSFSDRESLPPPQAKEHLDVTSMAAEHDTSNFQKLLRALELPKAEEFIIRTADPLPAFTGTGKLLDLLRQAISTNGRSHGSAHYAELGVRHLGDLQFQGPKGNLLGVKRAFFHLIDEGSCLSLKKELDVVFIHSRLLLSSARSRIG
ncbi:hypothetical protein BBP40_001873 [Aspergillus hancockii]|nr:hypothetical protein BBP40_001873 [Aspergillus hancockii]